MEEPIPHAQVGKQAIVPGISIVVPVYNQEIGLPELHRRLVAAAKDVSEDYEIIFINDGSQDKSIEVLKRLASEDTQVRYIHLSRNFGHQLAVTSGLDHAFGKVVVIIDDDLQDPPELIPEMFAKHKEGYEVVYARRKSREGESAFKKWSAKLFYRALRKMTDIDIPLDTGDFRLMDQRVVAYLRQMPERNKFIRGQVAWLGFNQTYVTFDRGERKHGETGYSLSKLMRFALDGVTSFSDKPLLLVAQMGGLVSFLSFLIILYAIYSHFVLNHSITGWTSMIVSSMFIGGVQLLSLGILGLYVSRMNTNILKRPAYIIAESNLDTEKKA